MPSGERLALLVELAGLVGRMARARLCHEALHPGSVLVRARPVDGKRLVVVGLGRVRRAGSARRCLVRTLVPLAELTRRLGVGSADRVRFVRAALAAWRGGAQASGDAVRRLVLRVRRAWSRYHERRMRARTRRCLADGGEFATERLGEFIVLRRRSFPAELALRVARAHEEAALSSGGERLHKRAARTEISRVTTALGTVYVKAFLRRSAGERLKDLVRPNGRARIAWVAHHGLRVRGLPAPAALALLEARNKLSGRPDLLIVRAVEGATDLASLSRPARGGTPALSAARRRALGLAVAELFRSLAAGRVRHPDMKPSNILVRWDGQEPRLWLVDLDRMRFGVRWRQRHWVHHLAQCNAGLGGGISLLDRMRCLRRCGAGRWSAGRRLRIARLVMRESLGRNPAWLRAGERGGVRP